MKIEKIPDRRINILIILSLVLANCMEYPYILYQYFKSGTLIFLLLTEFVIYCAHIALCILDSKNRRIYRVILILYGITIIGCIFNMLFLAISPNSLLPEILIVPYGLAALTCSPCFSLLVNLYELPRYIGYISQIENISNSSALIRTVSVLRWLFIILIVMGWLIAVKTDRDKRIRSISGEICKHG